MQYLKLYWLVRKGSNNLVPSQIWETFKENENKYTTYQIEMDTLNQRQIYINADMWMSYVVFCIIFVF